MLYSLIVNSLSLQCRMSKTARRGQSSTRRVFGRLSSRCGRADGRKRRIASWSANPYCTTILVVA